MEVCVTIKITRSTISVVDEDEHGRYVFEFSAGIIEV